MRLSTRLAIAMVGLVLFTAVAVVVLSYRNLEAEIVPRALEVIEGRTRLLAGKFAEHTQRAVDDLPGLRAAAALSGILRARESGGFDPVDGVTEETWRQRMADQYAAELAAKPAYYKIRVIGVEDGGREIVRVDRSGAAGTIHVAPDSELQHKGDREFFTAAIGLRAGEIAISPIELNQENGVIEIPHVPVLRTSTPIYTPDSKLFGILVINLDMRPIFEQVRSGGRLGAKTYVVDSRGNYLVHPDRSREFGFEFEMPFRWQDEFPDFVRVLGPDRINLASTETIVSASTDAIDSGGESCGTAISWVRLATGAMSPRVGVLQVLPNAVMMEPAAAVRRSGVVVGLVSVLWAGALALLLTRSLTTPLAQITVAVEGLAHDRVTALPTDAGGEIGVLARVFAKMAGEVRDKTVLLEREVDERRRVAEVLNNTFSSMQDAVIMIDKNGNVMLSNPAAARLGVTPGVTPQTWQSAYEILSTDGETPIPLDQWPLIRASQGEIIKDCEIIMRSRKDGKSITLVGNGGAIQSGTAKGAVMVFRDITESKETARQLLQAQKMDAIGQLTGGVAHDFNNMLTVITGTIEILATAVADHPQFAAIAKMIDEAAQRGAAMTQHLLAFARKQPLQPRTTDINALVIDAVKLLRPTLGDQVAIETMLEEDAHPALVDPNQLVTALINLALNSRDAMPSGGKLTLETGNVLVDESYARMHQGMAIGPHVMIAVSDSGSGIAPENREKVFEPFFTTKGTKGTGLGLSMVYGFVKQSGGHVDIYSEEGHGTTIKIYFPHAVASTPPSADPVPAAPIVGGHEAILIVEDDAMVRGYVATQVQSLGYRTIAAGNSAEALAIINGDAEVNLLFTDVIMPAPMNGRQLADAALKLRPSLKVLFTSGYTKDAITHHGRLDPGVLLLTKPYRRSDLARMIRVALETAPAGTQESTADAP